MIIDEKNESWFKANDIGEILEFTNHQKAVREHIREKYRKIYSDIRVNDSFTPANMQHNTVIIKEPGFYSLIMKSKMREAEEFQAEVLPSIRKHGEYKIKKSS